jgi:hypothetical protein
LLLASNLAKRSPARGMDVLVAKLKQHGSEAAQPLVDAKRVVA